MALLLALTAASVLVFANTSRIPTQGTTTIAPNKLIVFWDEDYREPVIIETFRFYGFNVAQLRTMVNALDGTVDTNADGTFQVMPSGSTVRFSPVSFNVETEIDYIVNQTSIRNHAGTIVSPNEPGFVFLPSYGYNWASVRDVIDALDLTLVDVLDDPETGVTEVLVARPTHSEQKPTDPQPTDQRLTDPQPTDQPSADPLPTDQPFADPQPTDQPSADPLPTDQPSEDSQPTDQPSEDPQPTDQPPADSQPTGQQSTGRPASGPAVPSPASRRSWATSLPGRVLPTPWIPMPPGMEYWTTTSPGGLFLDNNTAMPSPTPWVPMP